MKGLYKMTRVFMSGEAGDFNYGDQAMAVATTERIRTYFPNAEIFATGLHLETSILQEVAAQIVNWPSPQPRDRGLLARIFSRLGIMPNCNVGNLFERSFSNSFKKSHEFRHTIELMEQSDFFLDMGHGGINDIFGGFLLPYFYWIAGHLGKPLFVSGKTVGPLKNPIYRQGYRIGLRHAHTIVLRDSQISKNALVELHLPKSVKLIEAGDDTLDFKATEPDWDLIPRKLAEVIRFGEYFAVQWRPTDYTRKFSYKDLKPLANLVAIISKTYKLLPVFIPTAWEGNPDILSGLILKHLMPPDVPLLLLSNYIGARGTKYILGRAVFGIGLSYHFHVWLLSQGRPAIGIFDNPYYETKIKGAFAAYGFSGQPLRLSEVAKGRGMDAVHAVKDWNSIDADKLLLAAENLRCEWHRAFRQFIADKGLCNAA